MRVIIDDSDDKEETPMGCLEFFVSTALLIIFGLLFFGFFT